MHRNIFQAEILKHYVQEMRQKTKLALKCSMCFENLSSITVLCKYG